MRFKIGDKVRVKEDLVGDKMYGLNRFVRPMEQYKGKIYAISNIFCNQYQFNGIGYLFTEEMVEEVNEEVKEDKIMKFSVGDKVRVREDLVEGEYYGDYMFTHDMKEYKGYIFEISKVLSHEYLLKDIPSFLWTNEMLELVKNEENNVSIKRSVCLEYTNSNGEIKHFFLGDEVEVIDDTTTSYTGRITSVTLDSISMDCSSKFEAKVIEKYIADILEIRPYNEDEI